MDQFSLNNGYFIFLFLYNPTIKPRLTIAIKNHATIFVVSPVFTVFIIFWIVFGLSGFEGVGSFGLSGLLGGVSDETYSAFGSIVTLYSTFPLISDGILTRNGADSNLSVPLSTFPICASR